MTGDALYLDVAGHPSDQPVVSIAGFLADEENWTKFETSWKEALARNGLPSVFHMTDFEYKYKDHPDHWQILEDLIRTIRTYTRAAFACSFEMENYRYLNMKFPLEEVLGTPYALIARCVVRSARFWRLANHRKGPLLTFVEKGTLHQGDMWDCFDRDKLERPIPIDKKHPSAQAADLYAWEMAYYMRTKLWRPSYDYLQEKFPEKVDRRESEYKRRNLYSFINDEMKIPKRRQMVEAPKIVFQTVPKKKRRKTIK